MSPVVVGVILLVLGLLPGGLLARLARRMRRNPQVSREDITIPANDRIIRIVRPEVDSRYEFRLSSVVVVGDKKPDHRFDFCLLHDMEVLALYEQGKAMPYKRYQRARRVIDWRTYMQTGPGLDFALVFVNPHPYDLGVHIKQDYYPVPRLLQGRAGFVFLGLSVLGGLVSFSGIGMILVGVVQWLR